MALNLHPEKGMYVKYSSRVQKILIGVCILVSFTAAGCNRDPRAQKAAVPLKGQGPDSFEKVLAIISADEQPVGPAGPSGHGGLPTDQGRPVFNVIFGERGGVAYTARKDGKSYVVFNGRAGKQYDAVGDVAISPDSTRVAYGGQKAGKWHMVVDGVEGDAFDEVGTPVFSPDGKHVAYEVRKGDRWHVALGNSISPGCESYYEKPVFSIDSLKIFLAENTKDVMIKHLITSGLDFQKRHVRSFRGRLIVFSADNKRVAAVEELRNGKRLIEIGFDEPAKVKKSAIYDDVSHISFSDNQGSTAFATMRGQERFIVFGGSEEKLPPGDLVSLPVIRPDGRGVGILMGNGKTVSLHQLFLKDDIKDKAYEAAGDLVYSGDGLMRAYVARRDKEVFVVINGKEGPAFDIVIKPIFSPDGKYIAYRARKDGRRFVIVGDSSGNTIRQKSVYEQVFQPVFTSDGKSVAYGAKDGNKLLWRVEKLAN